MMPSVHPVKYVVLGILYIRNTDITNRNDMNCETSTHHHASPSGYSYHRNCWAAVSVGKGNTIISYRRS